MTPAASFALVVNPRAGRNRGLAVADAAARLLSAAGRAVDVLPTERASHGAELARIAVRDHDAVIAVGGDGTLNEILHGLIDVEDATLGIVPIGTANVVARELGIPLGRPEAAARVLLANHVAELRFGFANGRPFVANAGVGFDARVVHLLAARRREAKGPIGMSSYLPIGFGMMRSYRTPRFRVRIDGRTICESASAVTVCNTRNYGGVMALHPDAGIASDRLHACVRLTPGRRGVVRHFWFGLRGRRDADREVCYADAERIEIESDEPEPVQIDGDDVGVTPLVVELAPRRLRMLVPPR